MTFAYDGGAQPEPRAVDGSAVDSSAVSGTHGPAKFRWRTGFRVAVLLGLLSLLLGGWFWWDVGASRPHVVPLRAAGKGKDIPVQVRENPAPPQREDRRQIPHPERRSLSTWRGPSTGRALWNCHKAAGSTRR